MNYPLIADQRQVVPKIIGSLDHAVPQDQMKAIHIALQQYFEAEDWLAERSRRFPGLLGTPHQRASRHQTRREK
jgi:hypothetical protein